MQDRPFPFARAVASIAAVTDRDTFDVLIERQQAVLVMRDVLRYLAVAA
jgi:hypothetical protein